MRIVFVNLASEWGGAERYTADLTVGLGRRGHEVTLVARPGSVLAKRLREAGHEVLEFDPGLTVGWHSRIGPLNHPLNWADLYANPARKRFQAMLERVCESGVDVLHAQHIKEKLWVTEYAKACGVKIAWTVHAPLEPWMKQSAPGAVHRWARTQLDGLLGVCHAALEDYVSWGFRPAVQAVVHNGIDIDAYASGDREKTRRSIGVDADKYVVLVLARPYRGKGIDCLLDALRFGKEKDPSVLGRLAVLVAGESAHVRRYRDAAARSGVADAVRFLGHRDDVPDLLAAADAMALPSLYEGLPYAISEAMAASRPVIATSVGGVPEMVVHGETGLLIEPGRPQDLWEALRALAVDPDVGLAMGRRGRERAERLFRAEAMLDGSEEFFDRVRTATP